MNKIDVRMDPILLKKDDDFSDYSQQALMSWCEDAVEQFLETLFCKTWKRNKKEIAAFFIHGFVDYAYGYHLAKPFQYDARLVENMCLDILPRKMSTDAEDFKLLAPILIGFFEWCQINGYLKNAAALHKKLQAIDHKIYKAAKNPSNWGLAKSIFSGLGNF